MIAQLVTRAEAGGVEVATVGGRISLDESWSPYVQADLTIPRAGALPAGLDPRVAGARVRVRLSRRGGSSWTLAEQTGLYGSGNVAAATAVGGGDPLSATTALLSTPFEAPRAAARFVDLDLAVLRARTRWSAAQIEIEAASDEALAQLDARVDVNAAGPFGADIATIVNMVLEPIGRVDAFASHNPIEDPFALRWEPGQTRWDVVSPLVDQAGLRLFCDEARVWHLQDPLAAGTESWTIAPGDVVDVEDDLTLIDDVAGDSVLVRYTWRDSAGATLTRFDAARATGKRAVVVLEREQVYPGDGAAAAAQVRTTARERQLTITAVSDPAVLPGTAVTATLPDTTIVTGVVAAVTFDLNTDRMRVRIRDLEET